MNGWELLGGETNKQTKHWTTGELMMLDCAWGSWRVMSQRKGEEGEGEKGEGEGEEKGEEKVPTYNYVITSLRRLDLAAMYICNVNLFWFFPTSPPANRNHRRLSHLSLSKVSIFNSKKKENKKEKKMYRIVSCRVANARVGYRIKCLSKV